ncbi:hypothetical protein ITP31_003969 [Salmonella enterica]|uniref:hypothetical protein n=1 Tax=Serratia phage PCH45 TaxID=2608368 RepID=UPI0012A82818|nr:hypothetical protein [Salmonella enterica]QFP93261.1 hypothetical protein [Serratia phage PCH45]
MADQKTTEVTHEITFNCQIVHGPAARELAKKIFNEQLRRFQEVGIGNNKPIDLMRVLTRKEGDPL